MNVQPCTCEKFNSDDPVWDVIEPGAHHPECHAGELADPTVLIGKAFLTDDEMETFRERFREAVALPRSVVSLEPLIDYPGLTDTTENVEIIEPPTIEWVSLPKKDIPDLAAKYIDALETQKTDKWCSCVWKIHPDDVEKPEGKRRKVRIDENEHCTLHTKVGLIMGFFVFTMSGEAAVTPELVKLEVEDEDEDEDEDNTSYLERHYYEPTND